MSTSAGVPDQSTDVRVGTVLLVGLICSISVMVAGAALSFVQGRPLPAHVLPLDSLVGSLREGHAPALVDLGILFLFATPFLGVLAALAEFLRQADRAFTLIATILLLVLCAGFIVATR